MRIGISLLNLRPGKMGGVETYIRKLAEYFPQFPDAEPVFFVNRATLNIVQGNAEYHLLDWSEKKTTGMRLIEAFTPVHCIAAEKLITAARVDGILFPHQAMFPIRITMPSVLTVVDVQHLYIPNNFSRFDHEFRKRVYADSLLVCSRIAAISEVTKQSLVEKCKVDASKVDVVHLGCDHINTDQVKDQNYLTEPYLFFPAASYPHKGHDKLFRSYAALKRSGEISEKLVLTGMKTAHWKTLSALISDEGMSQDIIHLGFLSYPDILSLYKGAAAILFPTEFEGFGMPVIEANQFGKKVICSKLRIFDELGVPPEWQIDYAMPDQLLTAIRQTKANHLQVRPNTWEDTIQQTFSVLKKAILNG